MISEGGLSRGREECAGRRHFIVVVIELQGFVEAGRGLQGQFAALGAIVRASRGRDNLLEQVEPADQVDCPGR